MNIQDGAKVTTQGVKNGRVYYIIVTDLINTLPGNSSVNTVQHAAIDEAVSSMSSAQAAVEHGVMQHISKQQLVKHPSV